MDHLLIVQGEFFLRAMGGARKTPLNRRIPKDRRGQSPDLEGVDVAECGQVLEGPVVPRGEMNNDSHRPFLTGSHCSDPKFLTREGRQLEPPTAWQTVPVSVVDQVASEKCPNNFAGCGGPKFQ